MFVKWQHQSAWSCAFVINVVSIITEKVMSEAIIKCIVDMILSDKEQAFIPISLQLINFIFTGSNKCSLTNLLKDLDVFFLI